MNNFNKIQPIEGFYFSNYLMDNTKDNGKTKNGKFTITKIDNPESCEVVTWGPKCMVPIKKVFRIAHPVFRGNYFKINFKFFPPKERQIPLFYLVLEKMWGIKI